MATYVLLRLHGVLLAILQLLPAELVQTELVLGRVSTRIVALVVLTVLLLLLVLLRFGAHVHHGHGGDQ